MSLGKSEDATTSRQQGPTTCRDSPLIPSGEGDLHRRADRTTTSDPVRGNQLQEYCSVTKKGLTAMLVLSRKKNESIVINNDITVTVVEIRGDKVRLGIVAPKEVPVHRQEVYEAIHGKPATPPPTPVVVEKQPESPTRSV